MSHRLSSCRRERGPVTPGRPAALAATVTLALAASCGLVPEGGAPQAVDHTGTAETPDTRGPLRPLHPSEPELPFALNSVFPNSGSVDGGTEVTLVGTGFRAGMVPELGGVPVAQVRVVSATEIRALTPPAAAGAVDVTLAGPEGLAALPQGFLYFESVAVRGVAPDWTFVHGGKTITVHGAGFVAGTMVRFGSQLGLEVEVLSESTVRAVVPPLSGPGRVDVRVLNLHGEAALVDGLRVLEPLRLDDVRPFVGSAGTELTVVGAGFARGVQVQLGGEGVVGVEVSADGTELRFRAPPGVPGPAELAVHGEHGHVRRVPAFYYLGEREEGLQLWASMPAHGWVEGGDRVHLAGRGFGPDSTSVAVGGALASSCVVLDAHQLTCTTPPGAPGTVDVVLARDDARAVLPGGFTYRELELRSVYPVRGAVAGGTAVRIEGAGLVPGVSIWFGARPARDLVFVDDTLVEARTPPGEPGPVDVEVRSAVGQRRLAGAFTYFDPLSRYDLTSGPALEGAVNVSVMDAFTGAPVSGAYVLLGEVPGADESGYTDAAGQVVLSRFDLRGPVQVTAAKAGYESFSVVDLTVEALNLYLYSLTPPEGSLGELPPLPLGTISGTLRGFERIPKDIDPGDERVVLIGTTARSIYSGNPDPGAGATVRGNGPFSIVSRTGDVALVAVGGILDGDTGVFEPAVMGVVRWLFVIDQQDHGGVELVLDIPLDARYDVTLAGLQLVDGLDTTRVFSHLDFGAEGTWSFPTAEGVTAVLGLPSRPALVGPLEGVEGIFIGGAFTGAGSPYTLAADRDVVAPQNGVTLGPLLGIPLPSRPAATEPLVDGELSFRASWEDDPSFNLLYLDSEAGLPVWTVLAPSKARSYRLPELAGVPGAEGIPPGVLYVTVTAARLDEFDFGAFRYAHLSRNRWRAWSNAYWTIRAEPPAP